MALYGSAGAVKVMLGLAVGITAFVLFGTKKRGSAATNKGGGGGSTDDGTISDAACAEAISRLPADVKIEALRQMAAVPPDPSDVELHAVRQAVSSYLDSRGYHTAARCVRKDARFLDTLATLIIQPPPLPFSPSGTASFTDDTATNDGSMVFGGAVGRWMYAIHRSNDMKDYDVVWFNPDTPKLFYGARRNGIDHSYVTVPIGAGIDTSHAANPSEGAFSEGVGVIDKSTGWSVYFMASSYNAEAMHMAYVDIVAETAVRVGYRETLEIEGPRAVGVPQIW